MKKLSLEDRRYLQKTIIEARRVAEDGAKQALQCLCVHLSEPGRDMNKNDRLFRAELINHISSTENLNDWNFYEDALNLLVQECSYETWHRMLFVRFLSENGLLIDPLTKLPMSLSECKNRARKQQINTWNLAAQYAHYILPQVFRKDLLVLRIKLNEECVLRLEQLVQEFETGIFQSSDAIGWIYEFWQSKLREDINRDGTKVGKRELPAITQLFTEPYMVEFLLHNSIGTWWANHYPNRVCPLDLTYLRTTQSSCVLSRSCESWPDDLSEFRLIDPCCGSGYFLVAAFLMLVPIRMEVEELSVTEAVRAVLSENIYGLDIDRRCVEITIFALSLEAWRYPGLSDQRDLPDLNLAWCGQPIIESEKQWVSYVRGNAFLENIMVDLRSCLQNAPLLGSLIDPLNSTKEGIFEGSIENIQPIIDILGKCQNHSIDNRDSNILTHGLIKSVNFLSQSYHLVLTNVPYLGREKQDSFLRAFCDEFYPFSKHDLATVFIERVLKLCDKDGISFLVVPQYWLFLTRYRKLRQELLTSTSLGIMATLGSGAFHNISGEVVNSCLIAITPRVSEEGEVTAWIDASEGKSPATKIDLLKNAPLLHIRQSDQLKNPDSIIGLLPDSGTPLLESIAYSYQGLATSDNSQFVFKFWEFPTIDERWELFQFAPDSTETMSGCSHVLFWDRGGGRYADHAKALKEEGRLGGWKSGHGAWGTRGIAINRMGDLPVSLYYGSKFDCNVAVIIPDNNEELPAIWEYCQSNEYRINVRKINSKLSVTNATLAKVPFEASRWKKLSNKNTIDLFKIETFDPTQWSFHGHPRYSAFPLQVVVARLVGYQWPVETGLETELSDNSRAWLHEIMKLELEVANDGIVCIPSMRGNPSATERILEMLRSIWGRDWDEKVLVELLKSEGTHSLDDWISYKFFWNHCKLFHQRPFVWHIWDGCKQGGFQALINYHKLVSREGIRLLESLVYEHIEEWISIVKRDTEIGARAKNIRIEAACDLQQRLVSILKGDPPFDIFVRWKPITKQAIGWNPDINDGVRLNIRPFMEGDLRGVRKGTGILRSKPNIHWRKDRGREPMRDKSEYPWFWRKDQFTGERINDVHLSRKKRKVDID